ncbi:unnamed protein product [Paramecium pentaurelia]|uniref:Transmembrane protein n=1 Tax=Paramecium pentaurelia TaxID=43138 RepID=A0A8S1YLJ3_9CILI|nr:unnamed protein product [Paramecium pentaurelia]
MIFTCIEYQNENFNNTYSNKLSFLCNLQTQWLSINLLSQKFFFSFFTVSTFIQLISTYFQFQTKFKNQIRIKNQNKEKLCGQQDLQKIVSISKFSKCLLQRIAEVGNEKFSFVGDKDDINLKVIDLLENSLNYDLFDFYQQIIVFWRKIKKTNFIFKKTQNSELIVLINAQINLFDFRMNIKVLKIMNISIKQLLIGTQEMMKNQYPKKIKESQHSFVRFSKMKKSLKHQQERAHFQKKSRKDFRKEISALRIFCRQVNDGLTFTFHLKNCQKKSKISFVLQMMSSEYNKNGRNPEVLMLYPICLIKGKEEDLNNLIISS